MNTSQLAVASPFGAGGDRFAPDNALMSFTGLHHGHQDANGTASPQLGVRPSVGKAHYVASAAKYGNFVTV